MTTIEIVLGIILIVMAIFLIVSVLMQSGKDKGLSGTISGGAETFFGKSKAKTLDKKLSILTAVIAVLFVGIVLAIYVTQDVEDPNKGSDYVPADTTAAVTETAGESDTAAAADTAAATEAAGETGTEAATEADADAASDTEAAATEAVTETAGETAADTAA